MELSFSILLEFHLFDLELMTILKNHPKFFYAQYRLVI